MGYALQELSRALLERTGTEDRTFKPVSASEIGGLDALCKELDFVNALSEDMAVSARH